MYYKLYTKDKDYFFFVKILAKNSYNYLYKIKNNLINLNRRKDINQLDKIFKDKDIKHIKDIVDGYIKEREYANEKARKTTRD